MMADAESTNNDESISFTSSNEIEQGERAFQGGQRSGVAGYVDLYVQALDECGRGDPHPFGALVFQTFVQHGRTAESLHAGNGELGWQSRHGACIYQWTPQNGRGNHGDRRDGVK